MYPTTMEYCRYLGRFEGERTEEDKRRAREAREGFERCFLPPGVKLTPRSEMQD